MQTITYTEYPLVLFLTYNKNNAPDNLPFEVIDDSVSHFLLNAKGVQEMFGYFGAVNTHKPDTLPLNYFLPDTVFINLTVTSILEIPCLLIFLKFILNRHTV